MLTIGISAAIFGLSLYLNSIRDTERVYTARPGRKQLRIAGLSPGLALRLQRAAIVHDNRDACIRCFLRSVMGDLEGFLESSELIRQMIPESEGFNLTQRFVSMLMTILSILGTIPVLMFILKHRSEEKGRRTEHLLSRAVSRYSILGSYTSIAVAAAPVCSLCPLSVCGLPACL